MPFKIALQDLTQNADRAASFVSALSNPKRVLIFCMIVKQEMSVGALAKAVGLSQSALSQHLAKLRGLDLVSSRREAQTIFYRVASPHIELMLSTLSKIYIGQVPRSSTEHGTDMSERSRRRRRSK